jgi:isopropylmalate/homocitrate/citramalate synthase
VPSPVTLYDTTLRDGAQREGLSLTVDDKLKVAAWLDELGVHYVEGGWPGSNPKDIEFFRRVPELRLRTARIACFGATRRPGGRADSDPGVRDLVESEAPTVTIVATPSWVTDDAKTSSGRRRSRRTPASISRPAVSFAFSTPASLSLLSSAIALFLLCRFTRASRP